MMYRSLFIFLNILLVTFTSFADKKLPIPRFASIKFDEVNARTGPAADCPVEWKFIKKGEPIEIIAEYDQWRQIRDIKGEGGWVQVGALAIKRHIIVTSAEPIPLIKEHGNYTNIVAYIYPEVRCKLNKCANEWCNVVCDGYKGWLARKFLWGIYPEEKV
jgi:SH3-like domain-containing protein